MAEVKWIKIVTDIFDDEKILLIESLPDADSVIVIWFKLLCLAGRQNNGGVFLMNGRIAYTDEMFATIFRRPLNTVRMALSVFEQYGMIEIINDTVTIPNWEKHQQVDALEKIRESNRRRTDKCRKKQKMLVDGNATCNVTGNVTEGVTVTLCNAIDKNKIRPDEIRPDESIYNTCSPRQGAETDLPAGFAEFWAVYPRKVAKQNAVKAWNKAGAAESKELADTIIADVKRRAGGEWLGGDVRFVPHPATYLNQHRWEDEVSETRNAGYNFDLRSNAGFRKLSASDELI